MSLICDMIKGNESQNFNFYFLTPLFQNSKMLHFDANLLQLDIWLQNYDGFDNAKDNMKQRNLNTVFANISKPTSPTSDSFLLIMSHMSAGIVQTVRQQLHTAIINNYTAMICLKGYQCHGQSGNWARFWMHSHTSQGDMSFSNPSSSL